MATVQVLEEGFRNYIIKVTGTGGDSAANIVDVSSLNPPCTRVILKRVTYDVGGAADTAHVDLLWDATTDVLMLSMSTGSGQTMDFKKISGLANNAGTGITGDVLLTSTASTPYTIVLHFVKCGTINIPL